MEIVDEQNATGMFSEQLNHWSWKLHTYGFGSLYLSFGAYVSFCLIREWKFSSQKKHVRVMSFELAIAAILRAVTLFWNPHFRRDNSDEVADVFAKLLWGTASVFVTSAFSILLLILLESTKITLGPSKFRKLSVLLLLTAANYLLLIIARLIVVLASDDRVALIFHNATISLWGLGFCAGYAVASIRMWRNVKFTLRTQALGDTTFARETRRLRKLLYRTVTASVLSALLFLLMTVMTAMGFNDFTDVRSLPQFWTWYSLATVIRIFELLVMFLIVQTALKAKRKPDDTQEGGAEAVPNDAKSASTTLYRAPKVIPLRKSP